MLLIFWIFILAVCLFGLVKSSEYFISSAKHIGLALGIPEFIIGVTLVSVGTSLPELLTSIFAVISKNSEIVIGNVIGSNVTNIFLGLGILPLIIGFFTIEKNVISVDLPILLGSSFIIAITCHDGIFTRYEALFCIGGFLIYMRYASNEHRKHRRKQIEQNIRRPKFKPIHILYLIVSCAFLYFSAQYTIEAIIKLAQIIDIGTEIISASALALGTSLPEIVASIVSARRGSTDIAVGTVLGSNIFNAFAIMGVAGLIGPLIIPERMMGFGIYMLIAASLLYFFITLDRENTKFEGSMLLVFYVLFLVKLFQLF
ncbi:MAG TPA: calcium/sodium antiporter [bacterium]|nr:calcium/sodium antiporter [bacterium]